MKIRPLVGGIATLVPGVGHLLGLLRRNGGGTDSARYCYSVWLRRLVMAKRYGLDPYPKVVAELGPGDSLGVGLAALISGCDKYFAFDVVEYASAERNIKIFDELVKLFKNKDPIPGDDEFPEVKPRLETYDFPVDILDDDRLQRVLEKSRLARIKDSISDSNMKNLFVQYKVPWYGYIILEKESVDMIYSQAVLEHVDDLRGTYRSMYSWLKQSGYVSHQIDFRCHGTADEWNGHWAHSDFMWKLIRGKRPYLINRAPHAAHISILIEEGFKIVCDKKNTSESRFTLSQLAPQFRSISDDDLIISGAFIQGVKKTGINAQ